MYICEQRRNVASKIWLEKVAFHKIWFWSHSKYRIYHIFLIIKLRDLQQIQCFHLSRFTLAVQLGQIQEQINLNLMQQLFRDGWNQPFRDGWKPLCFRLNKYILQLGQIQEQIKPQFNAATFQGRLETSLQLS